MEGSQRLAGDYVICVKVPVQAQQGNQGAISKQENKEGEGRKPRDLLAGPCYTCYVPDTAFYKPNFFSSLNEETELTDRR